MPNIISIQKLGKKFNDFEALKEITLQVPEGSVYGFLGPNGSGKSTTLRILMGLMKPTSGSIELFQKNWQVYQRENMQRVGCIIEKPDFYGYLSAKENLALFVRAGLLRYTDKQYKELFETVGLSGREQDKVKTFSHGMKQRLGIAQAILHNPDLIILDEPNTGLDPQGMIDLRQLILRLNKEQGKTVLFSSHILSEVQEICTDMVVIHNGRVVVEGNMDSLLSEENLHVRIEVKQLENCLALFATSKWGQVLSHDGKREILIRLPKREIPNVVHFLSQQHIDIERIDYKNQLEDYFLQITSN
jgi:ABC-type multidrug transport system ATPase subunit